MQKVGRNDPCPCKSGKKFKKCCELKETHKKFKAELLSEVTESKETAEVKKISSLFFKKAHPPSTHSTEPKNPVM